MAETVTYRKLEAGEVFVAKSATISLEIAPIVAGAVRVLEFRGYRLITEDDAEVEALVKEINSPACPWAVSGEYLKKEELDPLNAVRKKAVEDYLASVAKAQQTASTSGTAAGEGTGVVATTDAAKASIAAAQKAVSAQLAVK